MCINFLLFKAKIPYQYVVLNESIFINKKKKTCCNAKDNDEITKDMKKKKDAKLRDLAKCIQT